MSAGRSVRAADLGVASRREGIRAFPRGREDLGQRPDGEAETTAEIVAVTAAGRDPTGRPPRARRDGGAGAGLSGGGAG